MRKVMRNNVKTVVWLAVLTIICGAVIWCVDVKSSKDKIKDYAPKDNKAVEAERLTIPVHYYQFVKLIHAFKQTNYVSLNNMGEPSFSEPDSITTIDISSVPKSGRSLIASTNLAKTEWCSGTICTFKTEMVGEGDTVVYCPAAFMAKLVDCYEGRPK